jgi:Tol biopolymer transport system component
MRRRLPGLLFYICSIVVCRLAAAEETSYKPYLGQEPPGTTAVVFAPGVVSLPGRYEYALSVSPDGKEIVFSTEKPGESSKLMMTRHRQGGWTGPRLLQLTQGARKAEMEAFFTPDGDSLFLAAYDEGMDVRIWFSDREGEAWGPARQLESPVNGAAVFYPTFSPRKTLYFTNIEERQIYRSRLENDSYPRIEAVNVGGFHAFVAPDGSYLLSDANGDIQVSFRDDSGAWSEPRPLGKEVNTPVSETCPSVSPDGKYLFFSRYPEPDEISDIFWVDARVITNAGPTRAE